MNVIRISPPVHPGEILRDEFLVPLGLTAHALAKAVGVPRTRIERLAREETPVTPDTALRLGRVFSITPEFWLGLQAAFDLARHSQLKGNELKAIVPCLPRKAAA